MQYRNLMIVGVVAPALVVGACNKRGESRDSVVHDRAASTADDATKAQQQREEDISRLDKRVVEIEREYTEANQKVVKDRKTPTAGLKEEVKEDVNNVKQAVNDLRSTTPANWWSRHEAAMKRTADDIDADVSRLAGNVKETPAAHTKTADGETVSTGPFESARDTFVTDMRARVDAMKRALDNVKADGPKKTELEDVRARVNKLSDDLDRLKSAKADDWWDVTRTRVAEYVDRVEGSVKRLDDRG
jgi:chromosome segregation ATPase